MADPFKPEGLCKDCQVRPATETWTNSYMELNHGSYEWICRRCMLKRQLEHAMEQANRVPKLIQELFDEEQKLGIKPDDV